MTAIYNAIQERLSRPLKKRARKKTLPKRMLMMHNYAAQVQFGHKSVLFGQDFGVMELLLWNEKRYVPYKVAALVEVLAEQGIAPEASLSGTGLSSESLSDPDTRTSVLQYITVCRNALQLSKTPETPFRTGSRIPLSAYGMYGFALVSSPTIREYFQVAIKYTGSRPRFLPCRGVKRAIPCRGFSR